jgi:CelD/BcsL family acetyltransferase involved in cellulose biosynthesis
MLIDLPSSTDEYYRSLGKSTRKTIRGYRNRLERAFPDLKTETIVPGGRSRDIVDRLAGWKIQRFQEKGSATYWETDPGLAERTAVFLGRGGRCRITSISGREAAIHLNFRIGDTVFGYESSHDPAYDAYRLGFLTMYDAVCAAIESGATRFDAMPGDVGPKEMLGARRVVATQVTVHRSSFRRELYLLGGRVSRHPRGAALLRSVDRLRSSGRR